MLELLTMKLAEAESPVLPLAITAYVPGVAVLRTLKEPLKAPEVIVQDPAVMMFAGVLVMPAHASVGLKPLPVIVTVVGVPPEGGP